MQIESRVLSCMGSSIEQSGHSATQLHIHSTPEHPQNTFGRGSATSARKGITGNIIFALLPRYI